MTNEVILLFEISGVASCPGTIIDDTASRYYFAQLVIMERLTTRQEGLTQSAAPIGDFPGLGYEATK